MNPRSFLLVVLLLVLVHAPGGAEAQLCFRVDDGDVPASDDGLGASRPRGRTRVRHREHDVDVAEGISSKEDPGCHPVDVETLVVVPTVTETEQGRVGRGVYRVDVPSEAATRTCACAAVRFVCGAHKTVSARVNRFARSSGASRSDDDDVFQALCGAPCDTNSACAGANADDDAEAQEIACVAPVCDALCGDCTKTFRDDSSSQTAASLDALRGECGDQHACLCAQCLEKNLFVEEPELGSGFGVTSALEKTESSLVAGRFGGEGFGGVYGQSQYAPGYGGYGASNPYRPGQVGQGNTPYGPYPGSFYPGWAIYKPWFVAVYTKSAALVASSLCYWYPWYPSCYPPPPRSPPKYPPSPDRNSPPPSPFPGQPPPPIPDDECGDPALGNLTCEGIPCEGTAQTCTLGDMQCCCDAGCVEFGDCCADRDACCLLAGAGVKSARSRTREEDRGLGAFQALLEAGGRRGPRREKGKGDADVANRTVEPSVSTPGPVLGATVPPRTPQMVLAEEREAPVFQIPSSDRGEARDDAESTLDESDRRESWSEYFADEYFATAPATAPEASP